MQNKLMTLTTAASALLGLSVFVVAQSKRNSEFATNRVIPSAIKKMPPKNPVFTMQLGCATKAKEMNQFITVTNTTDQLLKKGTLITYEISAQKGSFKLMNDLSPNAKLVQESFGYEGNQGCKAWY
jgi:hypothetical protein